MKHSCQMVQQELNSQRNKWGLEHDINHHGSAGLAHAATIIASPHPPDTTGFDGDEWYFELWRKYQDDPAQRYAIAAAMLYSAIDCCIYEKGLP